MKRIYIYIGILLILLTTLTSCKKEYNVMFCDHDGTVLKEENVKKGTKVTAPTDPIREGYTFTGWDNDFSNIQNSIIINAKYKKNNYTVSFDTDGGTLIDPITQEYDTLFFLPNNPIKEGYVFIGWEGEIPERIPSKNITLKAIWSPNKHTLTFEDNDTEDIKADYNSKVTLPIPTKEGHTFNGWLYNDKLYNGEITVTNDMSFTPSWNVNKYKVTFNLCNDMEDYILEVEYGKTLNDVNLELIPSYAGYRFNEIYYDSEYKNIAKYRVAIKEDITLYVKWDKIYYIEYELNGGYEVEPLACEYIAEDIKYLDLVLKNPKKDGYYFRGWYDNPELTGSRFYKISYGEENDYKLYAKWEVANLENAYLSIIGDSISTYKDYIPKGHIHFPEYAAGGSITVNQTWWKQTVDNLGCKLGINNSYSGTCVMDDYGAYTSSETLQRLRKCMRSDNIPPDIIVVFMGMNDCLIENVSTNAFEKSYRNMIERLHDLYPDATLFFATLSYEYNYVSKGEEALKKHLESKEIMNNTIRSLAKEYNHTVIEFANAFDSKEYLLDSVHTNLKGMTALAEVATKTIKEYYKNQEN